MAAGDVFDTSNTEAPPEPGITYDQPVYGTPDFARYIPTAALEQIQRNDEADAWSVEQRGKLADLWNQTVQDQMDQIVQKYTGTTPVNVDQMQGVPIQEMHISASQPEPQPDLVSGPESVSPTQPDIGPTHQQIGQQIGQGILQAIQGAVPGYVQPPQSPEDALQKAAIGAGLPVAPQMNGSETPESLAAKNQEAATHFHGGTVTGQIATPDITPPNPEMGEAGVPESAAARLATAGEEAGVTGGKAAAEAGQVAGKAAEAAPEAVDPIQKIVSNLGLDLSKPADVQRLSDAQDFLNDPKLVQNMDTVVADNLGKSQAPDNAMGTRMTDAYALRQEIQKAAATKAAQNAPISPETKAALGNAQNAPADIQNAVLRQSAREAEQAGDTQTAEQIWESVKGLGQRSDEAATNPPTEPPVPPTAQGAADLATREALSRGQLPGEEGLTAAQRAQAQAQAEANVAQRRPPGAPPVPPTAQGAAAGGPSIPLGAASLARPISTIAGGIAGGVAGYQQQPEQDSEITKILHSLPYALAGATAGYGLSGAATGWKGLESTAGQALRGSEIGPNTGLVKGLTDINTLLGAGATRATQALAAGRIKSMAPEAIAQMWGQARAFPDAWSAGLNAMKDPDILKQYELGLQQGGWEKKLATASLQPLAFVTEFTKTMLEDGAEYANHAIGGELPGVTQGVNPQEFARNALFLGEPEGNFGNVMLHILQPLQQIPVVGGALAPYIRVPINLTDKTLSAMPVLGAMNLAGRKAAPEVAIKQAMAAITTFGLMQLYGNNIRGASPSDPQERAMLPNGWKPNTVKIPSTDTWVSMRHLPPPIQGPLRAVALLNDVRNAPGDKKIQAAVDALANTAGDMNLLPSWVQQIGNIVTTTGAQKAQEAGYALGSQVPVHWALRDQATAERSTQPDVSGKSSLPAKADDLQKFLASAGTLLKTKFPGTPEQSVPAQLTRSGMEQPNQNPGAEAYVNPLSAREDIPDPVSQEYQRVGVPLSTVPSKVTTSKGYEADLSGEQQRELTQLRGNYLADAIPKGGFQDAEEAQKAATRAEQDAVKDLVDRYPALDQSAVNKKDQKETQAKARVSNAPQSSAWSQALGQQAKSASSPAARPVTPSAKPTSDAWAKALGK